jgi:hypothetical protein
MAHEEKNTSLSIRLLSFLELLKIVKNEIGYFLHKLCLSTPELKSYLCCETFSNFCSWEWVSFLRTWTVGVLSLPLISAVLTAL